MLAREKPQISVFVAEKGEVEVMPIEEYVAGCRRRDGLVGPGRAGGSGHYCGLYLENQRNRKCPHRNAHASTNIEEFQAYSAQILPENQEAVILHGAKLSVIKNS